jgi:hypothetical protein
MSKIDHPDNAHPEKVSDEQNGSSGKCSSMKKSLPNKSEGMMKRENLKIMWGVGILPILIRKINHIPPATFPKAAGILEKYSEFLMTGGMNKQEL